MTANNIWRVCSSCKAGIDYDTIYWVCNVSTCNRKRMPTYFCSVSCWEAHLPSMRHRESWAVEKRSPTRAETLKGASAAPAPRSRSTSPPSPQRRTVDTPSPATGAQSVPKDILVVASKLKAYIKARSGFNTSERVLSVLSDHLRCLCDEAIRHAGRDERKTVLDRDIPPVRDSSS